MRRPTLVLLFLIFTVLSLTLVRSTLSNSISPNGVVLGQIEEQTSQYKKDNLDLQQEYFTKASLTNVASEAARLGFVEKKTTFSLSDSVPIALKR